MPIIKCFVSSDLKTKFNAEYIDSVDSIGNQKFSEHADYVFCYFPKGYLEDSGYIPEIFVTKKKIDTDQTKFKKYFDMLLNKLPKEILENDKEHVRDEVHEAWIESKLGEN